MLNSKNTIIFLSSILFLILTNTVNADFAGKWCWDEDSNISAFSIVINKIADKYQGGYYAVAQSGNKIDDNNLAFSFIAIQKNIIKTKFKAGISGSIGLIQLKLINDKKIDWLVLQVPKGEIYVPKKAILHRCE